LEVAFGAYWQVPGAVRGGQRQAKQKRKKDKGRGKYHKQGQDAVAVLCHNQNANHLVQHVGVRRPERKCSCPDNSGNVKSTSRKPCALQDDY